VNVRWRRTILILLGIISIAGCKSLHPGNANMLDRGPGDAQLTVESKLREQRTSATGEERWENLKSNTYQSEDDIESAREDLRRTRKRQDEAKLLVEQGPLTIERCLAFSLEFNDRIQSDRAAIRSVGGDELVTRSRFLPTVSFDLADGDFSDTGGTNETISGFRFEQALAEFGKDNPDDVILRSGQRSSLFAYEDTVRDVATEVRRRFYTVLLRVNQIAGRQVLLTEFQLQYDEIRKLAELRRRPEVDVLTARLNVLNEEARINALEKELLRQKIELVHTIGFPLAFTEVTFTGNVELLDINLDEAVEIAILRSTAVAQSRAAVEEQRRVTRQVNAEYLPDVNARAGWQDGDNVGGFSLDGTDGFFQLSAIGEAVMDTPDRELDIDPLGLALIDNERFENAAFRSALGNEDGFFSAVTVTLPIFEGLARKGRYQRERARLEQFQHNLRDTTDQVEVDVRTAYQTILEQRKELDLRRETVDISKQRLDVQEKLKGLGEISDNQLETFRNQFFSDQDAYFDQQIRLIDAQESLRATMRFFEEMTDE